MGKASLENSLKISHFLTDAANSDGYGFGESIKVVTAAESALAEMFQLLPGDRYANHRSP